MNKRKYRFILEMAIMIIAISTMFLFSAEQTGIAVTTVIEKAVLTADWKVVVQQCGSNEELMSLPVLRAIKGHALLALNQNNESLLLFLSVSNDSDRQTWMHWTEQIAQENSNNHVAFYLKGDALARLKQWDAAIQNFNKALKFNPEFVLALNARGVVYSCKKQWNNALEDFEKVCKLAPSFADAYASLGTLLILKKAPEGAFDAFEKALEYSPDYALAFNGRACAEYGLVKWEQANEDFARSGRKMALPLFLGNLRALAIAAEKAQLEGLENSPLFRITDFLDWEGLQQVSIKDDEVINNFMEGYALPETLDVSIIKRMNNALEKIHFYEKIEKRIELQNASEKLLFIIKETQELRKTKFANLNHEQQEQIRILNRRLIEYFYPLYIAKFDQRDPGTQLTLTQGMVNQLDYKKSLSADKIVWGQAIMDNLGRPFADALESTHFGPLKFLGKQLNRHFDFSTQTNRMAMKDNWGLELDRYRPGGVLADLRKAHIDKGEWTVTNWYGLAYVSN